MFATVNICVMITIVALFYHVFHIWINIHPVIHSSIYHSLHHARWHINNTKVFHKGPRRISAQYQISFSFSSRQYSVYQYISVNIQPYITFVWNIEGFSPSVLRHTIYIAHFTCCGIFIAILLFIRFPYLNISQPILIFECSYIWYANFYISQAMAVNFSHCGALKMYA